MEPLSFTLWIPKHIFIYVFSRFVFSQDPILAAEADRFHVE